MRPPKTNGAPHNEGFSRLAPHLLAVLGVVYGDIGTSPLYAVRESFLGEHGLSLTQANILGVMSLIFWSLILVISIKYLAFVLRADNHGEGGILALMALVIQRQGITGRRRYALSALGLFGAALLYGDSMITPAISVLSAVEGLHVATPLFEPYVIPISLAILVALFLPQHRGTERIGFLFGPVVTIWFLTIGALGVVSIMKSPQVLLAIDPRYAFRFLMAHGLEGTGVIGAIFLVVTGGEALYADMGHFGKRLIRMGWFGLVLPALVLNYLGQGALLMRSPDVLPSLFFHMAPRWALYPLVLLATAATVIASQAVISGAFSLTRQAIQLGYSPRMTIQHTSPEEIGQIYVPVVNWVLLIGTIALVLAFRRSGNLANAYGVAVSTTMLVTTVLLYFVVREFWRWGALPALILIGAFLIVDMAFFGANIVKIASGGWFPLTVAAAVFAFMTTWARGRKYLSDKLREETQSVDEFLETIRKSPPVRVPGIAIYLTGNPRGIPATLQHNLAHNKVLHERVILLSVIVEEIPAVNWRERAQMEVVADGMYRIKLRYGFMQDPNVPTALLQIDFKDFKFREGTHSYFLGKETLLIGRQRASGMPRWRKELFMFMSRNSRSAALYFRIPSDRVVEFGVQLEI
ncbi:MAG: potassium transporter Kup [Candidatus Tectomicrobia bacterium]|uniref:Probable potassium transport system protein Kup n=1 Tax=Tectimicrobiota bacterium TaxID=2528274 RepID=A0A932MQ03_UNCTE|nr:potassium transporter Kup [Candidatus Tectomicrobia bacterium]